MTDPKISSEGNWLPLLRITANDRTFDRFAFFPGIRELTIREGRREKDSAEWESLKKRIPSDLALDEYQNEENV